MTGMSPDNMDRIAFYGGAVRPQTIPKIEKALEIFEGGE